MNNIKDIKDMKDLKNLFPDMETPLPEPEEAKEPSQDELITERDKAQMKLYVSRDKKQRGGKQVTLIQGHEGPHVVMEQLLSKLKTLCSAGGSLKEGEIMIQGDHVAKVIEYLIKSGYKQTKRKGG